MASTLAMFADHPAVFCLCAKQDRHSAKIWRQQKIREARQQKIREAIQSMRLRAARLEDVFKDVVIEDLPLWIRQILAWSYSYDDFVSGIQKQSMSQAEIDARYTHT